MPIAAAITPACLLACSHPLTRFVAPPPPAGRLDAAAQSLRGASAASSAAGSHAAALLAAHGARPLPPLVRHRGVVSRANLLPCAAALLAMHCQAGVRGAALTVQFSGETGHGLGPTREFFSLVCRDLQLAALRLWVNAKPPALATRTLSDLGVGDGGADLAAAAAEQARRAEEAGRFVFAPTGLFPRVLPPGTPPQEEEATLALMRTAGRLLGAALQDDRVLELPLALPVCKWLVGQALDASDVAYVDRTVGRSLLQLEGICAQYERACTGGRVLPRAIAARAMPLRTRRLTAPPGRRAGRE